MTIDRITAAWAPRLLSVLRFFSGLLFIEFGMAKHLGFPPVPFLASIPTFSLPGIAGMIELVCGALLTLGLFTRPAAFVFSGELAFAYFIAHAPKSFYPILNDGIVAVLGCFVFLYIAAAGGGPWSLDAILRRR